MPTHGFLEIQIVLSQSSLAHYFYSNTKTHPPLHLKSLRLKNFNLTNNTIKGCYLNQNVFGDCIFHSKKMSPICFSSVFQGNIEKKTQNTEISGYVGFYIEILWLK